MKNKKGRKVKKNFVISLASLLLSVKPTYLLAHAALENSNSATVGCPDGQWTDGYVRYVGTSSNGLVRILLGAPGGNVVYEDNKYSASDPLGIAMLNVELVAYAMQTSSAAYCQNGKVTEFILRQDSDSNPSF